MRGRRLSARLSIRVSFVSPVLVASGGALALKAARLADNDLAFGCDYAGSGAVTGVNRTGKQEAKGAEGNKCFHLFLLSSRKVSVKQPQ